MGTLRKGSSLSVVGGGGGRQEARARGQCCPRGWMATAHFFGPLVYPMALEVLVVLIFAPGSMAALSYLSSDCHERGHWYKGPNASASPRVHSEIGKVPERP